MGRFIIGHYQRLALANRVIWKPWHCNNCGRRHPSTQLTCDWIKPEPSEDDIAAFRALMSTALPSLEIAA